MKTELSIAKDIMKENPRLSIVILDNLVELYLFNAIQNNAMSDYLENDGSRANHRIKLYSFFDEKIKYGVEKEIISKDAGKLMILIHKLRNQLYHTGREVEVSKFIALYYLKVVQNFFNYDGRKTYTLSETTEISENLKLDLICIMLIIFVYIRSSFVAKTIIYRFSKIYQELTINQ